VQAGGAGLTEEDIKERLDEQRFQWFLGILQKNIKAIYDSFLSFPEKQQDELLNSGIGIYEAQFQIPLDRETIFALSPGGKQTFYILNLIIQAGKAERYLSGLPKKERNDFLNTIMGQWSGKVTNSQISSKEDLKKICDSLMVAIFKSILSISVINEKEPWFTQIKIKPQSIISIIENANLSIEEENFIGKLFFELMTPVETEKKIDEINEIINDPLGRKSLGEKKLRRSPLFYEGKSFLDNISSSRDGLWGKYKNFQDEYTKKRLSPQCKILIKKVLDTGEVDKLEYALLAKIKSYFTKERKKQIWKETAISFLKANDFKYIKSEYLTKDEKLYEDLANHQKGGQIRRVLWGWIMNCIFEEYRLDPFKPEDIIIEVRKLEKM